MRDLTFGEQVKIILSRKGMTIKELAEHIEAETGKPMSRQNLTQRLGRDNFQEQDMRLIASILDCPFHLSIFPTENEDGQELNIDEETIQQYMMKAEKKQKQKQAKAAQQEDVYQQEFVFDDTMTASVAEEPVAEPAVEAVEEPAAAELEEAAAEELSAEVPDTAEEVYEEVPVEEAAAEYTTDEQAEYVDEAPAEYRAEEQAYEEQAYEEPAYEEPVYEETYEEPAYEEPVYEESYTEPVHEETYEEPVHEEPVYEESYEEPVSEESYKEAAGEEEMTIGEYYEMHASEKAVQEEPEQKKSGFRTGGFFKMFGRDKKKAVKEKQEVKPVVEKKPVYDTELDEFAEFEPVIVHQDEEEDLSCGEMNPYTGHEYQSNSVRMHPTRIGYVQVYDRAKHGWEDMTEWAFLGYQERKKAKLGKDYEPPIYLD